MASTSDLVRLEPDELERAAGAVLADDVFRYISGGAEDQVTLADNLAAWRRLRLRPRTLRDVSQVATGTTVLGTPLAAPVLVAPMGRHRLASDGGELDTVRAVATTGTLMVLSTVATTSLEDVAAAQPDAPRWFQLYVYTDKGAAEELVRRAAAAGYRAIVLTVDLPVLGNRHGWQLDSTLPPGLELANLGRSDPGAPNASLSFDDLEWLRGLTDLPVVVKGVLRADDARECVARGAAGIVVSNHGGRQLDGAVASADALREVADAVGAEAEVYVDGGVRRGVDVVRALALGARAVLVGRPVLWGLAVGGADGAAGVLDHLRAELARAMTLCGTPTVADVTTDLLAP